MVDAPAPRTSDEWARNKRIMPANGPIPGPFNPDANPYMKPVAWAFAQPCFSRIVFVMGTQMGKSVTMENIIGQRLDEDPTPCLYVAPDRPLIESTIEPKFMAMFRECESLWKKFEQAISTKVTKWIAGNKFRFAWAGSASQMSADSAGLVMVDEVDRIVNTAEGDSMEVVEARGDAYADSKIGYTATPTHGKVARSQDSRTGLYHWVVGDPRAIGSAVWKLWQSGTRHEWSVPCPKCGQYFIPSSELLWWPGKDSPDECSPDEAFKHARLTCASSGCQIEDKWRPWMNQRGVAVAPGESVTPDGQITGQADTAGFTTYSIWVSGLCSFAVKKSYGFLAKKLLAAKLSGSPAKLLAVYNTGFGECYAESGDVPTWEVVKAARYGYPEGQVLLPPRRIFCTVDVQGNRLVYVVRAWYPGMGSMLLEHGELWGSTDQAPVWDDLGDLLYRDFDGHLISLMGVDVGYRDDAGYEFIHQHPGRVIAMRGRETLPMPFRMERIEQNKQGKVRKKGDNRWAFDTTMAKRWVHSRFGVPDDRQGFWLLHQQVSDDYCKQIVGEEWRDDLGKFVQVGENHYLDCEGMQYILALREKLNRLKRGAWSKAQLPAVIRKQRGEADPELAPDDGDPAVTDAAEVIEPGAEATPRRAPSASETATSDPAPKKRQRFKVKRKF